MKTAETRTTGNEKSNVAIEGENYYSRKVTIICRPEEAEEILLQERVRESSRRETSEAATHSLDEYGDNVCAND